MIPLLVITNHLDEDPCYRLRIGALLAPLAQAGYELTVRVWPRGFLQRRRLVAEAGDFRAVILHRKLLDPGICRALRRRAQRIIYDVDDAVWQLQTRQSFWTRWRLARRYRATAGMMDHFAPGNSYLGAGFAECQKPVTLMPTVLEPAKYTLRRHQPTLAPCLVWIGTAPNLSYLREIEPVLHQARQALPGLQLRIICDRTFSTDALPVELVAWSLESEASALATADIGLAPTPENPWTLGKSGFKIIQYMAAGLPVIASPVGANVEIVVSSGPLQTGFLPATPAEWLSALVDLGRDASLRTRLGAAGRQRCQAAYSVDFAAGQWVKIFKSLGV